MSSSSANNSNNLRSVILLLITAVVLPTVCLLWFMTRAVRNESLAVRQQLNNFYVDQLSELVDDSGKRWNKTTRGLGGDAKYPYDAKLLQAVGNGISGLIIFDDHGKRIYPVMSDEIEKVNSISDQMEEVWRLEYQESDYEAALKIYRSQTASKDDIVRLSSYLNLSRCLAKLDRLDEAVEECQKVAFSDLQGNTDAEILKIMGNARLHLLSLTENKDQYKSLYADTFSKLVSMVFSVNQADTMLATDYNMFLADRALGVVEAHPYLKDDNQESIERIRELKAVEEYSVSFCQSNPNVNMLYASHERGPGKHRAGGEIVYSLRQKGESESFLFLFTAEKLSRALFDFEERFGDDVAFWIGDEGGVYVWGEKDPEGDPFLTISLSNALGKGWRASLYFIGENLFDKAVSRQRAIYTWTGGLVVLLILASGGFATQAINRQMKLNRLKNDFVATVTHELKTPLASMRVLVDTLLSGNYNDQQQAKEYLELISKENKRLTGLIDNFLTFSRMERNKQAFDMVRTSPAAIAEAAVDAVSTKFNGGVCEFVVKVDDDLPSIMADTDAMVTVLVNLLDNAYKYSNDDKRIELRVFSEDGCVCFAVADNGIGMTPRQAKKAFDRFYQADSSLARRAEGTGLGLAIVKFIVDAHKGVVDVQSSCGKGTTFTVKLRKA